MAWSTSGAAGPLRNRGGQLGAWLADVSYFLCGFSIWWCVVAGLRYWLGSLSRWLHEREAGAKLAEPESPTDSRLGMHRGAIWLGLALLLAGSVSLEWARLHRLEAYLPGHGGGILGYWLGPLSVQWLGFAGAALVGIMLALVGASLAFGFSWGRVAEWLGAWLHAQVESRREKREVAQDIALGQQAARERDDVMIEPRDDAAPAPIAPSVVIEPLLAEMPKSERVAKERQKPLFTELPDSRLPQVDLLDGALARQETVAPETLDRKEAQGLRCRGAGGAGPARSSDHALRDRARHRRQGLPNRWAGQGPCALAQSGVNPGGGDHSWQKLHGPRVAQCQTAVNSPVRDSWLQCLQRGQVQAAQGLGQRHCRCPMSWWRAPLGRASRSASTP